MLNRALSFSLGQVFLKQKHLFHLQWGNFGVTELNAQSHLISCPQTAASLKRPTCRWDLWGGWGSFLGNRLKVGSGPQFWRCLLVDLSALEEVSPLLCAPLALFLYWISCDLTQKSQYSITSGADLGQDPGFAGAASPALGEGIKSLLMSDYTITCLQGNVLFTNSIN